MKCPGSSQCQLIPAEVTKVDSANKTDKPEQICETDELNFTEEHIAENDEMLYMFYVNVEKLNSCPMVRICIGNQRISAVIDTGSQISLLSEELYLELRSEGVEGLELGVQNAVLVSAFGNKSKRIRVQAMIPIRIDDIVMDHIFLISPQLLTQALLGVDFCRMINIITVIPRLTSDPPNEFFG
jgi:hypothetical protein